MQSNIFLSYCHKNIDVADSIDKDFKSMGIIFQRDVRDVGYMESFKKYMERIRNSGYAFMIISDEYLKSENCMYEVIEFLKEKDIQDRVLLIVLENAQIYNSNGKASYVKFWKEIFDNLNKELTELPREKTLKLSEELKKVDNIYSNIDEFLSIIGDKKSISLSKLKENNYKEILDITGYDKSGKIELLFKIKDIKDIQERDIALDKFVKNNPNFPQWYFFRAYLANENGEYKKAKYYYEDYLSEISPEDALAHNNLANVLKRINYNEGAKKHYEEAIRVNQNFAAAHNNLGLLLIEKFNNIEEAKKHYLRSIEINPNFAPAHNNFAILLDRKLEDKHGAKKHFLKSIEINPNFAYAHYNLAFLLREQFNDKNGALDHYLKAIALSPDLRYEKSDIYFKI